MPHRLFLIPFIVIPLLVTCKNFQKRKDIALSNMASTMSVVKKDKESFPAKPKNCTAEVFVVSLPVKKFKEIAVLTISPIYQNKGFNSMIQLAFQEKACLLGGDAIVMHRVNPRIQNISMPLDPTGTQPYLNFDVPVTHYSYNSATVIKYLESKD